MKKLIPEGSILIPESAELKYQGEIFSVYTWPQTLFDGSIKPFEMLKRRDTVAIICIIDDKIIIIDDEQPHRGMKKTLPGGQIDYSDESTLFAAQRETKEETGLIFKNWKLVKVRQPYTKIEWFVYVYIAWEQNGSENPDPGPGEKITMNLLSFKDFKNTIDFKKSQLTENYDLFITANNVNDLINLKEFSGIEVDR